MSEAPKGPRGARTASQNEVPPTRPAPTAQKSPPAPAPGRTVSNPGLPRTTSQEAFRAISAARMQPIKETTSAPLSARLKETATDTALNVVGILRDLWTDFRNSDQFFKYKAFIVAAWLVLSGAGFVVACPPSTGPSNNIGARIVRGKVLDSTVISVVNDSDDPWEDVVVVVNGVYSSSVPRVPPRDQVPDNRFTVDTKKLRDANNKPPPDSLEIQELYVRTSEGRADLIRHGHDVD
ncbi:MAG: hypothetical protein IRZ16_15310 [Myxococcaceae bacterium]|nr:hypothetical protein [Myxococcaceae bacterium]